MAATEIGTIRALLSSKPRPQGWAERRARLDEVGSVWRVAADVKLTAVDLGGVRGEWSIVRGSDDARVLIYFHGGGYCSGSIRSHRRLVSEAGRAAGIRTLAVEYRLAPEHPFPAAFDDALTAWRFVRPRYRGGAHRRWRRQRRRRADSGADQPSARSRRGAACLCLARIALDRFDDVRCDARQQGCRRSAHP
jgi:hypothetical protein